MKKASLVLILSFFFIQIDAQDFTFDFETGVQGWQADWADYPIADSVFYQLATRHSVLPTNIRPPQSGIYIRGNNHSDDLFMFLKRKITGLLPNKQYNVQFQLQIASNAPTNAIGVGGSPNLPIKVGATVIEPKKIPSVVGGSPFYIMNIDKGNQNIAGTQMHIIGDTGVSDTTTVFTLIERSSKKPFLVTTNEAGELWVIVGTESAFEALTELYYSHIVVKCSVTTPAKDIMSNPVLAIHPNPSVNELFIADYKSYKTYEIYGINGQMVLDSTLNGSAIDISSLMQGHYLLALKNKEGRVIYTKFVKI